MAETFHTIGFSESAKVKLARSVDRMTSADRRATGQYVFVHHRDAIEVRTHLDLRELEPTVYQTNIG